MRERRHVVRQAHSGESCHIDIALGTLRCVALVVASGAYFVAATAASAQDDVQWNFSGRLIDNNPNGDEPLIHEFDKSGTDGNALDVQQPFSTRAVFSPNADALGDAQTLKSGATLDVLADNWDTVTAMGVARASYVDRLTVQADRQAGLEGGALAFTWGLHGKLTSKLTVAPPGGLMYWGYVVSAHAYGVAQSPFDPSSFETLDLFSESISRGPSINANQANCTELLDDSFDINLLNENVHTEERSFDLGQYTRKILVPYDVNVPATLEMHLDTCVNLRAKQIDIGLVNPFGAAEFQNTATLLSVEVLDENLQPVRVPYKLISDQGWTYPVQVPEPSGMLLGVAGMALAAIAVRRRRRIGPNAPSGSAAL